jgi:hypothetical protein
LLRAGRPYQLDVYSRSTSMDLAFPFLSAGTGNFPLPPCPSARGIVERPRGGCPVALLGNVGSEGFVRRRRAPAAITGRSTPATTFPIDMKLSSHVAAALLLASAPIAAQTAPELVGLARGAPAPILRQNPSTCVIRGCPTSLATVAARPAGGTAYDASRSAVWVSEGILLSAVDPVACREVCAPHALPTTSLARITGLAINDSEGVLVVTDADNVITQYKLDCPVTALAARCDASTVVPASHTIGGVATDDLLDLVIYSSSDFSGLATPGNTMYVARRADPCNPLCQFDVPACGSSRLGPITGVAFDPCDRIVWATDGQLTVGLRLSNATPCAVQEVQCCQSTATAAGYIGLCVVPSRPTAVGQSCTNLGCPSCPSMAHVATGDPALGNASFTLDLVDAPRGTRAALWIAGGACTPPGLRILPFCGPILVPLMPPPIVINVGTGPGLGCGGGFRVAVPIPLDRSLCGATLSSQCFGICSNLAPGTLVSNCLSWTITGT